MSLPRRSARLAPRSSAFHDHSQHRPLSSGPSFSNPSQASSTSTTSYPSPTADSTSTNPPQPQPHSHSHLQVPSSFMAHHPVSNAPLPSPSAADMDPFFGRSHSQPNPYTVHQQQQPTHAAVAGFNPQQQQDPNAHPAQHTHHNSFSHHFGGPASQPSHPGAMPTDFLAEAARRAQMACLMRDLGDVSL